MSAFATVERRRREELLAIQKQDRDQRQAQTRDEPVVPSPPNNKTRRPLTSSSNLPFCRHKQNCHRPDRSEA
jgi:hypothetical protein